jgi:DNA-binding response OmpR family regulator
MSGGAKILVVDDTPLNVKMLDDLLTFKGYRVSTAASGAEGLAKVESERPDLVLLDVMMPGMNGYEVCQAIRANPAYGILPVVMVTALDPAQERIKGIEAGADDFLSKPINQAELLARVKSLLRIKELYDTTQSQAKELDAFNKTLTQRVEEQVTQLERLGRLKRFFSPQIAESIVSGGDETLKPHRREISVVFLDLRGFTAFTESAEPEEVMRVLRDYHGLIGPTVMKYSGTLEHFAGDGVMIFFNDPVQIEMPITQSMRMALDLRDNFASLREGWRKRGHDLNLGVGIAHGYATLGAIGFEGRWDYAAIGSVTNLSARLCSEAKGGQIVTSEKTLNMAETPVESEPLGEFTLKGFTRPVTAFNITGFKQ